MTNIGQGNDFQWKQEKFYKDKKKLHAGWVLILDKTRKDV